MGGKSADPNKAAMRKQQEQMKRLEGLSLPELEEYVLQNPELVGLLDAEQLDPSALEDIQVDSKARGAQLDALQSLQEYSDEGITESDKYAMESMLGDVAAQEKSSQASIESDMARRGMDSSGAALMSKMNAKQQGSNNAREQAMQMAARGEQNRMSALNQLASQSGQMQNQDFARQSQVASAKDAISQANAQNRQGVNAQNLAARQQIENQRAGTANQQAQVGNQIAQQNYNNQVTKITGQGNTANAMSNIAGQPGGPSKTEGAAAGAAAGTAIMPGWGTAIGAGVGYLAAEDGGLINKQNEDKQHAQFKKKYMKKIHDEVLGNNQEVPKAADGNLFDEAFAKARSAHGGDGGEFDYNGKKYNTNLAAPQTAPQALPQELQGFNGDIFNAAGNDLFNQDKTVDQKIESVGGKRIGVNNDAISADIGSSTEAKDLIANTEGSSTIEGSAPEASGMSGDKLTKGLGALSKIMGDNRGKRAPLNLGSFNMQQPENVMTPMVSNFEDGGVNNELSAAIQALASLDKPVYAEDASELGQQPTEDMLFDRLKGDMNYEDGGCAHKKPNYEDGGADYYSDGSGDIVETGFESFADDRIDAKINDGEAVLNVPQQQRMMDLVRGKISVDELGNDDIIEGVPRDYRDELHEKVESGEDKSSRVRGLENLLDILGKE